MVSKKWFLLNEGNFNIAITKQTYESDAKQTTFVCKNNKNGKNVSTSEERTS